MAYTWAEDNKYCKEVGYQEAKLAFQRNEILNLLCLKEVEMPHTGTKPYKGRKGHPKPKGKK